MKRKKWERRICLCTIHEVLLPKFMLKAFLHIYTYSVQSLFVFVKRARWYEPKHTRKQTVQQRALQQSSWVIWTQSDTFDFGVSAACGSCNRSCINLGSHWEVRDRSSNGALRWVDWTRWRCSGWCWWIWGTCRRSCGGGGDGDGGDEGGWRGTLRWLETNAPPAAPGERSVVEAAPAGGAVWCWFDARQVADDRRSWDGFQRVRRYAVKTC